MEGLGSKICFVELFVDACVQEDLGGRANPGIWESVATSGRWGFWIWDFYFQGSWFLVQDFWIKGF